MRRPYEHDFISPHHHLLCHDCGLFSWEHNIFHRGDRRISWTLAHHLLCCPHQILCGAHNEDLVITKLSAQLNMPYECDILTEQKTICYSWLIFWILLLIKMKIKFIYINRGSIAPSQQQEKYTSFVKGTYIHNIVKFQFGFYTVSHFQQ